MIWFLKMQTRSLGHKKPQAACQLGHNTWIAFCLPLRCVLSVSSGKPEFRKAVCLPGDSQHTRSDTTYVINIGDDRKFLCLRVFITENSFNVRVFCHSEKWDCVKWFKVQEYSCIQVHCKASSIIIVKNTVTSQNQPSVVQCHSKFQSLCQGT